MEPRGCYWSSIGLLWLLFTRFHRETKPSREPWGEITYSFPSPLRGGKKKRQENPLLWPSCFPWRSRKCHLQQPEHAWPLGLSWGKAAMNFIAKKRRKNRFAFCLFWFHYLKLISGSFFIFLKLASYWLALGICSNYLFSPCIPCWPAQKLVKLWGLFRAALDNKMVYWLGDF